MTYKRRPESNRVQLSQLKRQLIARLADSETDDVAISLVNGAMPGDLAPNEVFGYRTESLFLELVNVLGKFSYIKQEDQGDWWTNGVDAQPPDYLLGDSLGRRLAVEVKNWHKPTADFSLRADVVDQLNAYSDIVGHRLKFAIYWSRWKEWTLVDHSFLKKAIDSPQRRSISLPDAMMRNEMCALGDASVYTQPPLGVRAKVTRLKTDRHSETESTILARIESFEVVAAGRAVQRDVERRIALHLLLYGEWQSDAWALDKVGSDEYFVLSADPPDERKDCGIPGYAPIGNLSRHFSNAMLATLEEGQVEVPEGSAGFGHAQMSKLIPPDFNFEDSEISLLVFHQRPSEIPPLEEEAWNRSKQ